MFVASKQGYDHVSCRAKTTTLMCFVFANFFLVCSAPLEIRRRILVIVIDPSIPITDATMAETTQLLWSIDEALTRRTILPKVIASNGLSNDCGVNPTLFGINVFLQLWHIILIIFFQIVPSHFFIVQLQLILQRQHLVQECLQRAESLFMMGGYLATQFLDKPCSAFNVFASPFEPVDKLFGVQKPAQMLCLFCSAFMPGHL